MHSRRSPPPAPRETHKNAARVSNQMRTEIPDWPVPPLTEPCYRATWGLPWAAFPPSLEAEADAFFAQAPSDDLFADDGPDRPLSPRTIATQKDQLRCVASALVRQGHAAEASPRGIGPRTQRMVLLG
ncbi:hypothetical protein [Rhodospirillaceae bacterium SYSU D60014]|uniref:hypothetical protein n=1 Tax=Virgifigura deserti TaxID=2268457 RepID=UPI000E669DAE